MENKTFKNKLRGNELPKYRLTPDKEGTYNLEKYNENIESYLCEAVRVTPERADILIKNLERKTLFYREN